MIVGGLGQHIKHFIGRERVVAANPPPSRYK